MSKRPTIARRVNEMTTAQRRRAYHWAREFCLSVDNGITASMFDAWARRETKSPKYARKVSSVAFAEVALRRAVTVVSGACRDGRRGVEAAELCFAKAMREAA